MLLSSVNHVISLSWAGCLDTQKRPLPPHTYTHTHSFFYTSWHISTLFHGSAHTWRHYTPQRLIITQVCHLVFIWATENLSPLAASPPSAFCLFIPSTLSVLLFLPISSSSAVLLRLEFCRLCSMSGKGVGWGVCVCSISALKQEKEGKVWISDRRVLLEENWSCSSQERQWCSNYTKRVVLWKHCVSACHCS